MHECIIVGKRHGAKRALVFSYLLEGLIHDLVTGITSPLIDIDIAGEADKSSYVSSSNKNNRKNSSFRYKSILVVFPPA